MESVVGLWRPPPIWFPGAFRMWRRDALLYKHTFKLNIVPNFFEPVSLLCCRWAWASAPYVAGSRPTVYLRPWVAPGLVRGERR